jgi:hypothetical protein
MALPVLGAIAAGIVAIVAWVKVAGAWLVAIGSAVWVVRLLIGAFAISAFLFDISLLPNIANLMLPLQTMLPTFWAMAKAIGLFSAINGVLDTIALVIGYNVAKALFMRSRPK